METIKLLQELNSHIKKKKRLNSHIKKRKELRDRIIRDRIRRISKDLIDLWRPLISLKKRPKGHSCAKCFMSIR
jgi:hypothetical protein